MRGGQRSDAVRPDGLEQAWLRTGVYLASVDEDVVVLDRDGDVYHCLPDAAAAITLAGDRLTAPSAWISALVEMGLAGPSRGALRTPLPPHPATSLSAQYSGPPFRPGLFRAAFEGWRHGPTPTMNDLLATLPARPGRPVDEAVIMDVLARFQTLSPWLPRQGACLYRASVLLRALRYAGQDAVWVFGVRTWPFSAHCWLQIGDQVLDDDPDRVGLYTPIMAV